MARPPISESLEIIPKEHKKVRMTERVILQQPYWERQPLESAPQYRAFLIYRDLPADRRTLLRVSQILFDREDLTEEPKAIRKTSINWSWEERLEAYQLDVQQEMSRRADECVRELKTEVEALSLRIAKRVRKIAESEKIEDLAQLQTDLAVIEMLCGKGNGAKIALEAYKSIVGSKIKIEGTVKLDPLQWKA